MNILIVSFNFPPFNTPGAVRVGGFAEEWLNSGHDVRVISATPQPYPEDLQALAADVPVAYCRWIDQEAYLRRLAGKAGEGEALQPNSISSKAGLKSFAKRAYKWFGEVAYWPDRRAMWAPFALQMAKTLLKEWKPDIILGSAQPFTSLVIAEKLAKRIRRPWVAEFRDPWATNLGYNPPEWRSKINDRWERRVVESAADVVTVSKSLAEHFSGRFNRDVHHIYTGYQSVSDVPVAEESKLWILYTGSIFPGRRDPRPLFEALRIVGDLSNIRVTFVGRILQHVEKLKEEFGMDSVEVFPAVDRDTALSWQNSADILLTVTNDAPGEEGTITTKFSEYLGTGSDILVIAGHTNEAARIVKDNDLGFSSNDPDEIAIWIKQKLSEKEIAGHKSRDSSRSEQFSRRNQSKKYLGILMTAASAE